MQTLHPKRVTKTFRQLNNATPGKVFPLLCPVREKDWIDGWEYAMVYSRSGVAEKGCVFTTPSADNKTTTWYTNTHDLENFVVEFVRMTPGEMVVSISIHLTDNGNGTTTADISYEYTSLNEDAARWLDNALDATFLQNMNYWEKAINHYLETGEKLLKNQVV